MKLSNNRFLQVGTGALLLLLILVLGRHFLWPRPVQIGKFRMPILAGWQQKARRSNRLHVVTYEKKESGNRLYIGLTWHLDRATSAPKTVGDLQNEATKGLQAMSPLMKRLNIQVQSTPPQPIPLNGMLAVKSQAVMTTVDKRTYGSVFNFVDGPFYYILNSNVSVPLTASVSAPVELQTEMDQALATIFKFLRPITS